MSERENPSLRTITRDLASGRLNRRQFVTRAVALGASTSVIAGALAACGGATTTPTTAAPVASTAPTAVPTSAGINTGSARATVTAATTATRAATSAAVTPAASSAASPTTAAGGPTKRGGGGTVKILQSQAPVTYNPHLSSGTKDDLIGRIVYEPLATIDSQGNIIPVLISEVPTDTNGGLAADGKSVTYKLKPGVKWSDGKPLTADDVVFTYDYIVDEKTAATSIAKYSTIAKVEKIDELTVKINFKDVTPGWFLPFFGAAGNILPKHIFEGDKGVNARNSPNNLKPVGTGPYKVLEFKPGDAVIYDINPNYREPNKPFFDRVELKGGGDATSAARAVLQTGDYDYAWNLQVEDSILKQLETGGRGVAQFAPGGGIERLLINLTDPNKEVDGERSSLKAPHPFLTDIKVRQALDLASDRKSVIDGIYGRAGEPGVNILYDPPQYSSKNNKTEFSLDKANALLEEAGYKKGSDGYRAKGDVKLSVLYQTTVNQVRQKTQQIIKDGWEKIGVKTELKSIDAGVFFSSDAGNPDTAAHFYADIEMYTSSNTSPDPQSYMANWHGAYVDQKANNWSLGNRSRWQNAEYDKLWESAKTELDDAKRAQLFIKMNDLVIQNFIHLSIVNRKSVYGRANSLQNINYSTWDVDYWNIANWTRQG
ncbi:MAG TPA: peptide ABC transporter substrate-binding protein [Thermomicrobiales bacterium]